MKDIPTGIRAAAIQSFVSAAYRYPSQREEHKPDAARIMLGVGGVRMDEPGIRDGPGLAVRLTLVVPILWVAAVVEVVVPCAGICPAARVRAVARGECGWCEKGYQDHSGDDSFHCITQTDWRPTFLSVFLPFRTPFNTPSCRYPTDILASSDSRMISVLVRVPVATASR